MSKDREWIAKGVPRNRYLIRVDDKKDKKRVLTYTSKEKAEAAFKTYGFYDQQLLTGSYSINDLSIWLEAVEIKIKMETV